MHRSVHVVTMTALLEMLLLASLWAAVQLGGNG